MPRRLYNTLTTYIHIVLLCLCLYTISSFASQITKRILMLCPLPLFLGEFQFIYTAFLAICACSLAYRFPSIAGAFPEGTFPDYWSRFSTVYKRTNIITRPSKHVLQTVLPLGVFQFVGKFFGHKATSLVPVSTVASIKTLSPVIILIIQSILGINTLKLSAGVFLSLGALISGVWIIVGQDSAAKDKNNNVDFSVYGIVCAIVSMLIFVTQNLYGKKVFTYKADSILPQAHIAEKTKEGTPIQNETLHKNTKYDKLTLLIYISAVGFCLSFGWFICFELPTIIKYLSGDETTVIKQIPWQLFLVNGTFHFTQAMITFHLLGELSTLTYSIANMMKRMAIISVSWMFVGQKITYFQIIGLILNAVGLFLYERLTNPVVKPIAHSK